MLRHGVVHVNLVFLSKPSEFTSIFQAQEPLQQLRLQDLQTLTEEDYDHAILNVSTNGITLNSAWPI